MSDAINPDHYKQGSIECIDAMQQVLSPKEFQGYLKGNVFKYIWREKNKNGIEDLRKAKWYLNRLIDSFDESEAEQLATGEVAVEVTGEVKPPDGWRWLEVGETLQRGDTTNTIEEIPEDWIGIKCAVKHNLLRRNRFKVGEKVIEFIKNRIGVVKDIELIGKGKAVLYHVEMQDTKGMIVFSPNQLALYIEDAT